MKILCILCLLAVQNLCYGQNCTDLQSLSLWGNRPLKDFYGDSAEKIGTLYLKIADNEDLDGIERLKCLQKLRIEGYSINSVSSLPDVLLQLSNLEDLEIVNMKGLNWTEAFKLVEDFPKLKRLAIKSSGLPEIPETVNLPLSLEMIELQQNQLTTFPVALLKLKKLRILNLSGNQLTLLPPEIGGLVNLEELLLGGNKLERIPIETGNLKVLRKLDLSWLELTELPQNIGDLGQLTYLNLYHNQFKKIPSGIFNLTRLEVLNLSSNQIRKIPPGIIQLIHLEVLDLSRNQISKIPSGIAALQNLKSLLLEWNLLTSLPAELISSPNLRKMDVSNNRLTDLPRGLKQLETFDVRGNLFRTEPVLFLFYKSKIDSIDQRYNSIVSVYNELSAQSRSFEQAYGQFIEKSLGDKDSLVIAYNALAAKICQYNGMDYIKTEYLLEVLPALMDPSSFISVLDFRQDMDKSHSSYFAPYRREK